MNMTSKEYLQQLEWLQHPKLELYVVPYWVKDAIESNGHQLEILRNRKIGHGDSFGNTDSNLTTLDSILTVEDLFFYHENVTNIMELLKRFGISNRLFCISGEWNLEHEHRKVLTQNDKTYVSAWDDQQVILESESYEKKIPLKDALKPFVEDSYKLEQHGLTFKVYPKFEFSKDREMVFVTFDVTQEPTAEVLVYQELEKFVTFLINQKGIKDTSRTEVFKRYLQIGKDVTISI